MWIELFLFIHKLDSFLWYPGDFQYFVRLWVLFKSYGECCFGFSRAINPIAFHLQVVLRSVPFKNMLQWYLYGYLSHILLFESMYTVWGQIYACTARGCIQDFINFKGSLCWVFSFQSDTLQFLQIALSRTFNQKFLFSPNSIFHNSIYLQLHILVLNDRKAGRGKKAMMIPPHPWDQIFSDWLGMFSKSLPLEDPLLLLLLTPPQGSLGNWDMRKWRKK